MTSLRQWARLAALIPATFASLPAQNLEADVAALKSSVKAAQTSGDNAWILTSAALVLMMTGPGLVLFYCGLVRRKNVLATMMQSFALMAIVTIVWAVFGYSLAFGEGSPFLGGLGHLFLNGVGTAPSDYAPTIPHQTFMVYQLMFAIITPALISGAFAERMKFEASALFCTLWAIVVYFPAAHMVWGKGGFLNAYMGGTIPVFDFAGGTVVHITSGYSALVCALYLGKRLGYPNEPMKPHNLVLSFTGACLLWVGWFGFNAGSALSASGLATSAFVNTHFGAAAGAVGWMVVERIRSRRASALGAISGAVAGLATVTQAAGFVQPFAAMLIGLLGGVICFWMVTVVKNKFGYDDSLDAFGVHGIGGTIGCIATGIFATNAINDGLKLASGQPAPLGLVDGNPGQILNQAIGGAIAIALTTLGTLAVLKICELTTGLRADPAEETSGLDVTQHGEEGYTES